MASRVYVGGLPRDATSREVQDAFSRYGHVGNVWIARNPPGFAFVDFEDPRDADDAIRAMDGRDFLGGRVRVELAKGGSRREGGGDRRGGDDRRGGRGGDRFERGGRNPPQRTDFKVRITDLPAGADWRDVKDHLRTAGEVTFCDVQSDGTAMAEFSSREDMENAVRKLDDKDFRGAYIRVTAASEGGAAGGRGRSRSPRRDAPRGASPDRRSRSRSPGARRESPRPRSRSPSPAAAHSPPPRKNSV